MPVLLVLYTGQVLVPRGTYMCKGVQLNLTIQGREDQPPQRLTMLAAFPQIKLAMHLGARLILFLKNYMKMR